MSSPFQKTFSAKSPLHNHGEIRKELRKAKNENEQDYSMERVSDLEEQLTNAKAAHKASKGDPEAKEKDRLDQNSQDANMPSPGNMLKKKTEVSPLNSYENPRGEVYLSDQPAFQQLQQTITEAGAKIAAGRSDEDQEEHLQSRLKRRKKRSSKKGIATERDEDQFLEDGKTVNPNFGKIITQGDAKRDEFDERTLEIQNRKNLVTNNITAKIQQKAADKVSLSAADYKLKYPNG